LGIVEPPARLSYSVFWRLQTSLAVSRLTAGCVIYPRHLIAREREISLLVRSGPVGEGAGFDMNGEQPVWNADLVRPEESERSRKDSLVLVGRPGVAPVRLDPWQIRARDDHCETPAGIMVPNGVAPNGCFVCVAPSPK
jgi:hypothetical protein